MLRIVFPFLLLLAWVPAAPAAEPDTHIVFLAGPKDHGFAGRHEYEADLRVLEKAFREAPNIPKVRTSFHVGKAPPAAEIADADVIVILSSSDRAANEIHPLFPPDPSTDHHRYDDATRAFLQGYDDLVRKRGMGVVIADQQTRLTMEDAQAIDERGEHILAVQPEINRNLQITWTNKNAQASVVGTSSNYLEVRKYTLLAGRMFTRVEDEAKQRRRVH